MRRMNLFDRPNDTIAPLPESLASRCLYVDDNLLVIDKPSGLHAVPGLGADKHDSLITRLRTWDPAIQAVHRLDRDTSGLMVIGRTPAAISALGKQFQARSVHKRYLARISGRPSQPAGEIQLRMRYDPDNKPRQVIDPVNGKSSHTRWSLVPDAGPASAADWSLVVLEPVTGRTHQLRLHMQSLGHPILGDSLYGDPATHPRLCLHASELAFDHPLTGQRLQFSSTPDFDSRNPS